MATHCTVRNTLDTSNGSGASANSPTLFPAVPRHRDTGQPGPTPPEPVAHRAGIACLAASSPQAGAKNGVEFFLLPARSILNRCDSERVPFAWTVNPYRGCEFGCRYCYARYTHEYMDLDGGDFEHKIFVKQNAGVLAGHELLSKKVHGQHIAIGTATDPYQPAEREFGVTRAILEKMALQSGLSVSITTKSNLVLRDLEVLRRIADRSTLRINMTVTTLRTRLARLLEPRAPRPDLRIASVRTLRDAGLAAGVLAMPVLPGLTDREEDLDALARAVRDAGANWFAATALYLMPAARKEFFPFLKEKFPRLARQYREWFERTGYAPDEYSREVGRRVAALRAKYGLAARPAESEQDAAPAPQQQLTLGL